MYLHILEILSSGHPDTVQPVTQSSHHTPVNEASGSSPTPELLHLSPPLPLYHPLGLLAQSVPVLDPALFGHPGTVDLSVDDYAHLDADAIRRSSARARRPAAKVRERDADDEMSAILDAAASTNGHGSTSPRKRRGGGAGGTRRRRRDANSADGTYPNPPKRTRNSRNPAFASPLAGPVITNEEDLPETEQTGVETPSAVPDGEDTQGPTPAADDTEVQEQRRSTRTRRARPAAAKRRHSSASETTTTSVSVSIATNARHTRSAGTRTQQDTVPQEESPQDVEMKDGMVPEESVTAPPSENAESSSKSSVVADAAMEVTEVTEMTLTAAGSEATAGTKAAVDTKEYLGVQQKTLEVHTEPETPAVPMMVDESTVQSSTAAPSAAAGPAVAGLVTQKAEPMDIDTPAVIEPPKVTVEPEAKSTAAEVAKVPEAHKQSSEIRKPAVEEKRETKIIDKPPHPVNPAPHQSSAPPPKPKPRELPIPDKPRVAPPTQKIAPSSWTRFAAGGLAAGTSGPNPGISHKRPRDEEKEEGELSEESSGTPPRGR